MLGRAMIELGWALAVQGHGEAGITQIHQALDMLRVRGIPTQEGPYQLAEAYLHEGQAAEGLRVLPERPIGFWLKGELLLHQSPDHAPEAEASFQQALAVARRQEAKSLELRAATSLARLWQQQGKTTEARDLLAPVYHWFTEGFDTKDLQEAKELIEELKH